MAVPLAAALHCRAARKLYREADKKDFRTVRLKSGRRSSSANCNVQSPEARTGKLIFYLLSQNSEE